MIVYDDDGDDDGDDADGDHDDGGDGGIDVCCRWWMCCFLLGWRAKIKMSIVVVVVVLFPVCLGWFLVHRARFRSIRAGLSCESDW
jgi:hypothetical protein